MILIGQSTPLAAQGTNHDITKLGTQLAQPTSSTIEIQQLNKVNGTITSTVGPQTPTAAEIMNEFKIRHQ
jgi:hypothetical protein